MDEHVEERMERRERHGRKDERREEGMGRERRGNARCEEERKVK